jgi:carbohydrate diacid regulator
MQITRDLAQQIRDKAKVILDRELAVTNANGLIVGGPREVGNYAPEALQAIQERAITHGQLGPHNVQWTPFIYENQVLGAIGVIDSAGLASETISLLTGLSEVIVHQYFLLDKMQSPEIVRSNFVKDMLTASNIDHEATHRQADILQINLRTSQGVILTHLTNFEEQLHATTSHLSHEEQRMELGKKVESVVEAIRKGFDNYNDNIASYMGDDTFVILKGIGGSTPNTLNTIRFLNEKGQYVHELLQKLPHKHEVTVGVGQYYPNLGGLRKSYQDAKLALQVGGKVWGRGRVYHVKQVGMFVTLANISQDRKAELAHQILHPLLRDAQLYKTVREFLASGLNLTEASKKLHIHRNTLIYRLDKTKKLINLDPRHFDDALQIKLGLMFYQPG